MPKIMADSVCPRCRFLLTHPCSAGRFVLNLFVATLVVKIKQITLECGGYRIAVRGVEKLADKHFVLDVQLYSVQCTGALTYSKH